MTMWLSLARQCLRSPSWWLAFGFLFWLSWTCADDWNHNPNYSYGWLILPLFLYFLFVRLGEFPQKTPTRFNTPSLWWLAPLPLLVFFIELIRLTPFFWRPIAWLIFLSGSATFLFLIFRTRGPAALRVLAFPLIFFALAIPWPTFIEISIIREFSILIAGITGEILLLLGIFAEVKGRVIELINGAVGVDEACSGLRSLQASLMVGLAVGEWFRLNLKQRTFLLLLALIGAFLLNLLRTLILSILVARQGGEALDQWHDPVGLLTMIAMTLCIFWIGSFFHNAAPGLAPSLRITSLAGTLEQWFSRDKSTRYLLPVTLVAFLLPHFWFLWKGAGPSPEQPFFSEQNWTSGTRIQSPPDNVSDILRHDVGGYFHPPDSAGTPVVGYHFFWKPSPTNGKVFFHRPDVCMPGGGWTQIGPARTISGQLNGRSTILHQFHFSRGNRQHTLYWMAWVDDQPVSFSGSAFSNLQLSFIPEFIRIGKRVFSVEIMGIMTPGIKEDPAYAGKLLDLLGTFSFVENEELP